MRLSAISLLVIVCLLSLGGSGAVCPEDAGIPFRLHRGYVVVVRGSIGPAGNLNFVIDTGAVPSVISERVARKLKLRGTNASLSTLTRHTTAERVSVHDVKLGPIHASELGVLMRDLSGASETLGTRVDAMIGFDLLGRAPFTIDYGCKKLFFGPIDESLTSVPYKAGLAFPLVELAIGGTRMKVIVDTGASALVLFATAARQTLAGAKQRRTERWTNLGGEVTVKNIDLPQMVLGEASWTDRDAFVLEEGEGPDGVHGLLGPVALDADRIAFDPEQSVFAWSGQ